MAANASFLEQELCCSVCCEIFKDPVVLKCSHSFCRVCLQQCWREKSSRECPICRRKSTVDQPPVSLALKNIVEYHLKQRNEDHCSVHGEKLKFFCEKDKETLCSMCQTSEKHRNHQVCSLEEAALEMKEELKTALSSNKAMLKRFTKVKQECEKSSEHIRGQAEHVERQVKAEFEKLHQFLRDEEEARLAELREEEKLKRQRMKEMIQNITRHISTLSDKITAIERAMDTEGISLLKTYKDTMKRAQCTLQSPKLPSGALIDVAKHIGNLKFRVCEKMMGMVQYTHVTLDPNTACSTLSLSDDLTSVRFTDRVQQLPNNPERFNSGVCVLGSQGFTSGKHSWEVEVGSTPEWGLGVVKESICRKEKAACCPFGGFCICILTNGETYMAYTSPSTAVTLERKPQRIKVELDCDRGEVSFYDPSDMSHIYTFKDTFTERLFPYFSPCLTTDGSKAGALKILEAMVSVTVLR